MDKNSQVTTLDYEDFIIKIELIDQDNREFVISCEDAEFHNMFNAASFRLREEDPALDIAALDKVAPENVDKAEDIIQQIRNAM
ncbi:MAG: hypothetical protein ABW174_11100 [Flavitalea sp.]